MNFVRTPDDRFNDLPDYDFSPHYIEIPDGEGGNLRVHHCSRLSWIRTFR